MAAKSNGSTVLMSLHPEFAERILDGSKKAEFRRIRPADPISCVVIYATQPEQRVVGFFDVEDVVSDTPESLWARYGGVAGIDAIRFRAYFSSRSTGHAIGVAVAYRLIEPVPLSQLLPAGRPPQSFQYLGEDALARLRRMPAAVSAGEA